MAQAAAFWQRLARRLEQVSPGSLSLSQELGHAERDQETTRNLRKAERVWHLVDLLRRN
jgi:hypothetical protein